jgi:hypothetical protein
VSILWNSISAGNIFIILCIFISNDY